MSEKHSTTFEYFDLHVDVNDEGNAEIRIAFPERVSYLAMTWDDLREVVDFAAQHAIGMKNPYVVEFEDTREGMSSVVPDKREEWALGG